MEDATAQKIIIINSNKKPLLHLLNCKTAFEMWNKIKAIFERDNEQQKCNLLDFLWINIQKRNRNYDLHK